MENSQFNSYNESPSSDLKKTISILSKMNLTDSELRLILSQLVVGKNPPSILNSQYGDH